MTDTQGNAYHLPWQTMGEICKALRMDWRTILKLKESSGLPVKKIGGQWYLSPREYDEWFSRQGST